MMTIVGDVRVDILKGAGRTNYRKAVPNHQRILGLHPDDDMIESKTTDRPRDAQDRS